MKISTVNYNNPKQGYLPLFLSDCLDLLDPVLTFDRLMGAVDVEMLQIYMLIVKDSMIDVVKNVFNLILKYFIDEISKGSV